MYCVKCGVELQQGAKKCPLCGLRVYHPELAEQAEAPLYPRGSGEETLAHSGLLFILSFLFAIPLILCLMVDLKLNGEIVWSGIVRGALLTGYVALCLPHWFRRANPVVFFPLAAAAALCYCLYLCLHFGGHWFLSFAFPVGAALALIVEALIVLMRYAVGAQKHRILYIVGGALIALGALCLLIEFLLRVSFSIAMRWWSLYPLAALGLLGLMLIVIALSPPLRRSLHKKFFI